MQGPCDWPVDYSGCENADPVQEAVEEMAVDLLWRWTGRVFGACPVTVRPCREDWLRRTLHPTTSDFRTLPYTCGRCLSRCRCDNPRVSVRMPGYVHSVEQVKIDGEVLPSSSYIVENHMFLTRVDGGVWPPSQLPPFEVTYLPGAPVPKGGQTAAGVLACELAKALDGDNTCRLPQRVQTVTRQGVSMAILDAFDDLDKGRTGIWLVDSWVSSVTQFSDRRSTVRSPDVPRQRVTTWTG